MMTTEEWLKDKLFLYKRNPKETLEDMLSTTTDVIEQYIKSPNVATKGVLEVCMEHNKLFLDKIATKHD
jgi:hypothetical protein